jgi:DNA-binding winged helix-turn-helix (wHTH) protein
MPGSVERSGVFGANRPAPPSVPLRMAIIQLSRGRHFDSTTGEVRAGSRTARLEPQPAALLALLAERSGHLVTHAEIRERLWADGRHVDYAASVHYAVRQVRRALDDGAGGTLDIESLPRRGYRLRAEGSLLAPVSPGPGTDVGAEDVNAPAAPSPWTRTRARWAVAALVAASLLVLVERQPNDHHAVAVAVVRAVHDAIY